MLIQKPVSRQEIQDWSEAKESGHIVTSPELVSEDDINSERISPRIIEQIQRYVSISLWRSLSLTLEDSPLLN